MFKRPRIPRGRPPGGQPTPITKLDDSRGESEHVAPVALHAGAHGVIGEQLAALGHRRQIVVRSAHFSLIPLMVALMGSAAAGPVIVSITIDMVITSSVCIALSRLGGQGDAGLGRIFLNSLRGVVVNPLPWAILLGGLVSATDASLPGPLMETIVMLADAGSPAALFTIGAVLARSRLATIATGDTAGDWLDIGKVVVLKLLFHPLLVLAVGHLAIALGAPVDPTALNMLALVAALPAASSIPMLSERYGADTGRIARIVMNSTALSILTFSAGVAWLG